MAITLSSSPLRYDLYEETGNNDLRTQSRALDELRQGDYGVVLDEVTRILPHSEVEPRFLPLVERLTAERAGAYDIRPRRGFIGASATDTTKLRDIYRGSAINAAMGLAEAKLVPQQTVVIGVLPDRLRRVRLYSWCPYEIEVTPGRPMDADDIQAAAEVRLRIPVGANDEAVQWGFVVMTPAQIYYLCDGARSPVFDAPEGGDPLANPFPAYAPYPLITLRSTDARKGTFFAPVDQGLLAEAIGLSLAITDLEHVVRHTQPQRVVQFDPDTPASSDDQKGLPTGVDNWVGLPPGATLSTVHSQAQVAEALRHIQDRLKNFASLRGLPSDIFVRTYSNIAALARQDYDRAQGRAPFQKVMRHAETELVQVIARVTNLTEAHQLPEALAVNIVYVEAMPDGGQRAAQARAIEYGTGERRPAQYVSERDGITVEAAQLKVDENRRDAEAAAEV